MQLRRLLNLVIAAGLVLSAVSAQAARRLATARPVMLVSDIDDTIKRTNSQSSSGVLMNGPRTRIPFGGMNDLYNLFACDTVGDAEYTRCATHQAQTRAQNRQVTYVTASPGKMQMFGALFLKNSQFPIGVMIGREDDENAAHFSDNLRTESALPDTLKFKIETILKIMSTYREFDFILVGDNGEKDVAAYDAVTKLAAQKFPGMKVHTYIHQVYSWTTGVKPADGQELYVTAGDMALDLFRRGLLSEPAVARTIDQTLRSMQADTATVFPPFLTCKPMLDNNRMPTVPPGLSPATVARAEKLIDVLKVACARPEPR